MRKFKFTTKREYAKGREMENQFLRTLKEKEINRCARSHVIENEMKLERIGRKDND